MNRAVNNDDPVKLIESKDNNKFITDLSSIGAEIIDLGYILDSDEDNSETTEYDEKIFSANVKLIDCYKYPWYYKRYTKQIINEQDVVIIDLDDISTEKEIDVKKNVEKCNDNIINNKYIIGKKTEKNEALNKTVSKNEIKIDLKRNIGLVGMKIKVENADKIKELFDLPAKQPSEETTIKVNKGKTKNAIKEKKNKPEKKRVDKIKSSTTRRKHQLKCSLKLSQIKNSSVNKRKSKSNNSSDTIIIDDDIQKISTNAHNSSMNKDMTKQPGEENMLKYKPLNNENKSILKSKLNLSFENENNNVGRIQGKSKVQKMVPTNDVNVQADKTNFNATATEKPATPSIASFNRLNVTESSPATLNKDFVMYKGKCYKIMNDFTKKILQKYRINNESLSRSFISKLPPNINEELSSSNQISLIPKHIINKGKQKEPIVFKIVKKNTKANEKCVTSTSVNKQCKQNRSVPPSVTSIASTSNVNQITNDDYNILKETVPNVDEPILLKDKIPQNTFVDPFKNINDQITKDLSTNNQTFRTALQFQKKSFQNQFAMSTMITTNKKIQSNHPPNSQHLTKSKRKTPIKINGPPRMIPQKLPNFTQSFGHMPGIQNNAFQTPPQNYNQDLYKLNPNLMPINPNVNNQMYNNMCNPQFQYYTRPMFNMPIQEPRPCFPPMNPPGLCDIVPDKSYHNFYNYVSAVPPLPPLPPLPPPPPPPPPDAPIPQVSYNNVHHNPQFFNSLPPPPPYGTHNPCSIIGKNNEGLVHKIMINNVVNNTPEPIDNKEDIVKMEVEEPTPNNGVALDSTSVQTKQDMLKQLNSLPTEANIHLKTLLSRPGPLTKALEDPRLTFDRRDNVPPQKGYSPPILPIPTYRSILSHAIPNKNLNSNIDSQIKNYINANINNQNYINTIANKPPNNEIKFNLGKNVDISKKISLEEYKKRST